MSAPRTGSCTSDSSDFFDITETCSSVAHSVTERSASSTAFSCSEPCKKAFAVLRLASNSSASAFSAAAATYSRLMPSTIALREASSCSAAEGLPSERSEIARGPLYSRVDVSVLATPAQVRCSTAGENCSRRLVLEAALTIAWRNPRAADVKVAMVPGLVFLPRTASAALPARPSLGCAEPASPVPAAFCPDAPSGAPESSSVDCAPPEDPPGAPCAEVFGSGPFWAIDARVRAADCHSVVHMTCPSASMKTRPCSLLSSFWNAVDPRTCPAASERRHSDSRSARTSAGGRPPSLTSASSPVVSLSGAPPRLVFPSLPPSAMPSQGSSSNSADARLSAK
mmetsp:Transcript_6270/g.25172  ORF Transcript_6270/g.25172 Transcript_6270/m.25172 type:complete len:340 (-) Transcript_6270:2737-3756(-)